MTGLLELRVESEVLHGRFAFLVEALDWLSAAIDLGAIGLLLIGTLRFVFGVTRGEFARSGAERVREMNRDRIALGRYILSALELFIVADIIRAATSLAFTDLLFLGMLVLIRSAISFFLDRELEQLKREMES